MKPRGKPFEKGDDARRNTRGQRNKAAVAFSKTLRELIVAEGEKSLTLPDGKRIKKVQAMVRKLWSAAINGEQWAVSFIAEWVEGKIKDELAVTHNGELQVFNHAVIDGLIARRPSGDNSAPSTG